MSLIVKPYGHDLGRKHRWKKLHFLRVPRGKALFNPERFVGEAEPQYVHPLGRENPLIVQYSRKILIVNAEPYEPHLFTFLPAMALSLSLRAVIFFKTSRAVLLFIYNQRKRGEFLKKK